MARELERIVALEVQYKNIATKQDAITEKLDELLALRNKGAGAFWLATSLAGVGAISIVLQILHFFGMK